MIKVRSMRNFRNYDIWKKGIELVKDTYKISKLLPEDERYGLKSQITRAAVSIPSNIAEGSSRSSDIEFKRFLEIALGSAFELETQLFVIEELEMCTADQLLDVNTNLLAEHKMINKFISTLKANS
jgi:four helix bundle protein